MWSSELTAVILLTIECLDVGLITLSKAAMRRGMSDYVFVVYSNALAVPVLFLCSLLFHRRRSPPPLTPSILCRIFLLGLVSCSLQMLKFIGIGYSSPTLASAMTNLIPAFTYVLAIVTRMEKLDLKVKSSRAKCLGTLVSVAGALLITIYKGPGIEFASATPSMLNHNLLLPRSNWIIGGFLTAAAAFMVAVLLVFQTSIIRDYPAELIVTLISHIFATMQSSLVSLIAERDPSAWRLRLDMELIAVGYSGIFVVALRGAVYAWVLHQKGPVFVAMFKPAGIVIAVIMGVTFLGDKLHLGSVIGAAIIALGFYNVVWGKAKEEKVAEDIAACGVNTSSHRVPLLQNKSTEV
ncbi:WAT1-related protein At5g40240-like [Vitis riparia]|uniref:WAT1-related protein At5g40240-like n=1 Tax=Vitis riparia TaxID=96939 RepID=UPI00155AF7EA|nr:WAT1-related protein At5g40240-like [Vitis riparia]